MTEIEIKNKLDPLLKNLATHKTLDAAEIIISELMKLINVETSERKLLNIAKVDNEIHRFQPAPSFLKQAAAYEIPNDKNNLLDLKLYWLRKTTKTNLSWVVGLTPNFEDSPAHDFENIGIDFIVPETADSLIILLSQQYKIRSLEIKDHITSTQAEIFKTWNSISLNTDEDITSVKPNSHAKLWESFNFEPINKKFYLELVESFSLLVNHLEKSFDKKPAVMFTTRLIGRLLFIWFLKKKNLINNEANYFHINKFNSQDDFYKNNLQILFFNVLNQEISLRNNEDKLTPYLNGGLFDINSTDFFNDPKLTFPNGFFNHLFDTLNKYNFTVDESSPEFQHVAIDPEMLGRIFESLLAEQIEESTGNNKKKATGAFYTPREIVSYMCEESVIQFLKFKVPYSPERDRRIEELIKLPEAIFRDQDSNKRRDWKPYAQSIIEALDGSSTQMPITILDPAVGSGAFPMGMLHLLVKIFSRLDVKYEKNISLLKRNILSKSLYGVDIEQTAIEICRLRAWLSIIVDIDEHSEIQPLPNLDFKFACANTLVPLIEVKQESLLNDINLKEKLMSIRDKYFSTINKNEKIKLQNEYTKLTHNEDLFDDNKTKQLKSYQPFQLDSCSSFYDPELHHGIKSFDILIGNPPYIKEFTNKKSFENIRKSSYYQGKMDLWYMFACRGIDFLNDKTGVLSFIATNNWVTNSGASILRNKVLDDTQILKLIDFGSYMIFDTASIQTMIMLFNKNKIDLPYQFDYRKLTGSNLKLNDVIQLLNGVKADNNFFIEAKIDPKSFKNKFLVFGENDVEKLLNKIKSQGNFYLAAKDITNGIHPHPDYLNKKMVQVLGKDFKVGQGVFALSKEELENLKLNNIEARLIKPYYSVTKLINRYFCDASNLEYIIYTDSSFKSKNSLDQCLNLKKHLDRYSSVITSDNRPYGLHRSRQERFFIGEKIVSVRKCSIPSFSYINFDSYFSAAFYIIKPKDIDLKFLTGLLNSKLITFWLNYRGKKQGAAYQIDKAPLLEIPIIKPDNQIRFTALVDQIISLKINNQNSIQIEADLDNQIYKLYNLTESEITTIESFFLN